MKENNRRKYTKCSIPIKLKYGQWCIIGDQSGKGSKAVYTRHRDSGNFQEGEEAT